MPGTYIPILVMLALATLIAVVMVVGSALLGPRHATRFKGTPYECGVTPVGSARERFPVQFYLIAMLFIIFDIETVFLYPWAVVYGRPGVDRFDKLFLLAEMGVFVVILIVGYVYIWKMGIFDWFTNTRREAQVDARYFETREPIRFGNEDSGPAELPAPAAGKREGP